MDLEWIAIGKRAGLSLLEMNDFRIRDLADYVDVLTPPEHRERAATQADIDAFLM